MVGLLDTSVVIALGSLSASARLHESCISAISLAELSVGPLVATAEADRVARQAVLQLAESQFTPLSYDALIAATAIRHQLPIYTRNPQDFAGITGLTLHNVA